MKAKVHWLMQVHFGTILVRRKLMTDRKTEIKKRISELNKLMAWTPGWLKKEIDELIALNVELANIVSKEQSS